MIELISLVVAIFLCLSFFLSVLKNLGYVVDISVEISRYPDLPDSDDDDDDDGDGDSFWKNRDPSSRIGMN